MSKIKSHKYLTINSLLNRLVTDEDVFQELERIGRVDFNKMHSIFQAVNDKYYGFAVRVKPDKSYEIDTIIEFYNVNNCNFVISYQDGSLFKVTRATWCGKYPTNRTPEFLSSFLFDINGLHLFCCDDKIQYMLEHNLNNSFDCDIVPTATMLKVKVLSLKYEKEIPKEFWMNILDADGYGGFLVENLFKRIKDEVSV